MEERGKERREEHRDEHREKRQEEHQVDEGVSAQDEEICRIGAVHEMQKILMEDMGIILEIVHEMQTRSMEETQPATSDQ